MLSHGVVHECLPVLYSIQRFAAEFGRRQCVHVRKETRMRSQTLARPRRIYETHTFRDQKSQHEACLPLTLAIIATSG